MNEWPEDDDYESDSEELGLNDHPNSEHGFRQNTDEHFSLFLDFGSSALSPGEQSISEHEGLEFTEQDHEFDSPDSLANELELEFERLMQRVNEGDESSHSSETEEARSPHHAAHHLEDIYLAASASQQGSSGEPESATMERSSILSPSDQSMISQSGHHFLGRLADRLRERKPIRLPVLGIPDDAPPATTVSILDGIPNKSERKECFAKLPTKQLWRTEISEEGPTVCEICLEKKIEGDEVADLACGHWFDEECLATWLKRSKTCPLCRTVVEP
jgi:E3 ubiquitin-protein ligase RNF181